MQKVLVQMNIQLTEVLSDGMGLSGELIIRDIVTGERNPKALARHRHSRVKASTEDIIQALTGNWREEHPAGQLWVADRRSRLPGGDLGARGKQHIGQHDVHAAGHTPA